MATETPDTYNKALAINLDVTIFGTFAEIGAGQETARWFLRVGAASGTVAKTISAYDKAVSDNLYGAGERYVSKTRIESMLSAEWSLLQEHLTHRFSSTRAFVFANTVSARNYAGTNQCHGWIGLRFVREPGAEVNEIVLHVNLLDPTNVLQQEALGILGVNLIYAAYFHSEDHPKFLSVLGQELGLERIQIDFIETSGRSFDEWNPRDLSIALVAGGLSEGVFLPHAGNHRPMNEAFYKLPVVIEPGRFEEREPIHTEMLAAALEHAQSEKSIESRGVLGVFCLSATESQAADALAPLLSPSELSVRANGLLGEGFDVLLTVHHDLYKISGLLSRFNTEQVRFVMGVSTLVKVLATTYAELHGRILEALSRLFTDDARIYVYPMALEVLQTKLTAEQFTGWKIRTTDGLVEADEIMPSPPLAHLYAYLLASGLIEPLRLVKTKMRTQTALKEDVQASGKNVLTGFP
jgi:hypothetical protein